AIRIVAWAPGYALLQHDLFLREEERVELVLARDARVSVAVSVSDLPEGSEVAVGLWARYDSDRLPLPSVLARGRLDDVRRWKRTGLPKWGFAVGLQADALAFVAIDEEEEEDDGGARSFAYRAVRLEPVPLHGVL